MYLLNKTVLEFIKKNEKLDMNELIITLMKIIVNRGLSCLRKILDRCRSME